MLEMKNEDKFIVTIDNKGYPAIHGTLKPDIPEAQQIEEADNFYKNMPQYNRKHQVMTFGQYQEEERKYFDQSAHEVTEEKYWEMLEVLPPIYVSAQNFQSGHIISMFMVSEAVTMTYYDAYCKFKDKNGKIRYLGKTINRYDKSTWITDKDIEKVQKEGD